MLRSASKKRSHMVQDHWYPFCEQFDKKGIRLLLHVPFSHLYNYPYPTFGAHATNLLHVLSHEPFGANPLNMSLKDLNTDRLMNYYVHFPRKMSIC